MRERALDARDDLLEPRCAVERFGLDQLTVVLAADVLQREALAGRRALVVEHAHGGPIVDQCIEQDRPCIRDDAVPVLQEQRERLEVGEARLLDRNPVARERGGEALVPLAVTWMRAEEQGEMLARGGLPP